MFYRCQRPALPEHSRGCLKGLTQGILQRVAEADGFRLPLDLRPQVRYNPDLVSRFFMVPAVLAMIVMIMTMMLSSMALVREFENGTMEQLLVTPLSPGAIIAGKLVPYALVGLRLLRIGRPLRGGHPAAVRTSR